jgi:hypothetical protein
MAQTVVAYFRDRGAADRAYEALVREGFSRDDISVLGRGVEGEKGLAEDVGGGEGALAGGIFGLLLGTAAMLIPGIGPVVAIGPLAAALTGAITGGVTGAVVGGITAALVHTGVPEEAARFYEERLRAGGYLITVRTDDARVEEARRILESMGGELHGRNERAAARATTPPGTSEPTPVTTSNWSSAMPAYRQSWERQHATGAGRWEDYEPVYQYGWQRHNDPRYQGRSWSDVEPELRRDWEQHHNMDWAQARPVLYEIWVAEVVSRA